jgi:hypothetical protein
VFFVFLPNIIQVFEPKAAKRTIEELETKVYP